MGKGLPMSTRVASVLSLLVLVACAAVGAVGCGGGTDEATYETGLEQIQTHLQEANEASQEAAGVEAAERGEALQRAHSSIDEAADVAEGLDPPSDVAEAHEQLAGSLREYAELFQQLANAPEDDPQLTELYGQAGQIVQRLEEANRAIADAGYEVQRGDEA
jgi:hypothetical protein